MGNSCYNLEQSFKLFPTNVIGMFAPQDPM